MIPSSIQISPFKASIFHSLEMVGYIAQPALVEEEEQDQVSKCRNPKHPLDPLDPSFPDFAFVDSILDFDFINNFLEDSSELEKGGTDKIEKMSEMSDRGSCLETPSAADVSGSIVKVKALEVEKEGNSGTSIEEVADKFGLDSNGSADCVETPSAADVSFSIVKVKPLEVEKEGNSETSMEEVMGKFGLDSNGSADRVKAIVVNSELEDDQMLTKMVNDLGNCQVAAYPLDGDDVKADGDDVKSGTASKRSDDSDDSESGEKSSSSSSSYSDSSSNSDSGSSSSDDEEVEEQGNTDEKEVERKEKVTGESKADVAEGDFEEGEIRDEEMACNSDEAEAVEDGDKMVEWSDIEFGDIDEEEEGVGAVQGPIMSKNELKVLPPVPPVNATLRPHHQMLPVGIVLSTLGAQVIVEGTEKHTPLNEGSILWISEKRSPLGFVDEIFGPVQNPYYVVRYNSESEVPAGIHHGTLISFVPEFAQHVLNENLYKKGYDASGENDEELTDEAEFSDDEKEAEYKKLQKMSKRGMNQQTNDFKRNNRNKNKSRNGNRNNNMPPNVGEQPYNLNQHNASSALTSMTNESSSTMGNEFTSGAGFFLPFPQVVPPNGIFQPSNGGWLNALDFQQPNGPFIPGGFPANNMLWPAQNQPFQQPFNLNQGTLPNGGQMNLFGAGPSPLPAIAGQNCFNQSLLGMGFHMQPTLPIMNLGGQGMMHNQPQVQPNCNLQPQVQQNCNLQLSDSQPPQQFNLGASSSHGRKPYRQGGGRFSGGRGR